MSKLIKKVGLKYAKKDELKNNTCKELVLMFNELY